MPPARPSAPPTSGACPEIVTDPRTGTLFGSDDPAELASAIAATLELGATPETVQRCREAAAPHDWSHVIERYEATYTSLQQ